MRATLVLFLAACIALTACGPKTVSNPKFGISFAIPDGWKQREEYDKFSKTNTLVLSIDSLDKPGIAISNSFDIAVMHLNSKINDANLFSEYYNTEMTNSIPDYKPINKVEETTVGGKKAYKIEGVFTNYNKVEHLICYIIDTKPGHIQTITAVDFENTYPEHEKAIKGFIESVKFE